MAADVVIDGAGYMVAPGSYSRTSDGEPEGRSGRWVQRDFVGGQRRALQLERDRGWDAEGTGPALGGQGVEPWPYGTSHADGALVTAPSTTVLAHHAVAGNHAYIGIGRYLYRTVGLTTGSWADLTQIADMGVGHTISDVTAFGAKVAVCCGSSKDIQIWDPGAGTLSIFSAGARGWHAVAYANQLIWADATSGGEGVMKFSTGGSIDSRSLDAPIAGCGLHGGKAVFATRSSLFLVGGKGDAATGTWIGEPEPLFSHGSWSEAGDYRFLVSCGGRLYTWLAGQVMEWNPNGGSSRQGWRATGIAGRDCFGAATAGDRLVVAVRNRQGSGEVWAFDGSGWWLIETGSLRLWPVFLSGAGSLDLLAFRNGSTTCDLYRLVYRDATNHNFRASGSYKTSLIDAGERDKRKAWRKIGASFASPEVRGNESSADSVTLTLSYSIDGGATFTDLVVSTVTDPTERTLELTAEITGGAPESGTIQIRVAWSSVTDWAPTLTGIWADYELLGSPAKRRAWRFVVHARDGVVLRDGGAEARSGRQIAADLWAGWQNGETIAFEDVDFDLTGTVYAARIVGIAEEIPKPADVARWGDSVMRLSLVEL